MAVKIRLKKMGRKHRPFFRICAADVRCPRDGKVIEELGTYDPMVPDTDARVTLDHERVTYWLGVGAQPTESAAALIKKYGPNGTHLDQARAAHERLKAKTKPDTRQAAPPLAPPAPAKKKPTAAATEESQEAASE